MKIATQMLILSLLCDAESVSTKIYISGAFGGGEGGRFWPIIDEIKAGPLTNYTLLPYFCGPNNYFGPHFYKQSISPPRTNPIKCVSLFLGTTLIPSRMKVSTREISSI